MKKLNWTRVDAKVSPDKDNPVLLIFCSEIENTGIPLRGEDVWNLMKLLVRSWFAHLRLKWNQD